MANLSLIKQANRLASARPRARILLVDDDERNLMALTEVLNDLAEVVTATSGREALRQLLRGEFAVILLDVFMILEIHIPDELAFGSDNAALMRFAAVIATYALSFVVIAIFWSNHHYLIFTLPKADRATVWLNNNALFWITLIPIVARFFGQHPFSPRAAASYAFVIMPVIFFVDPKLRKDPDTKGIDEITLSYTFYPVENPETPR